MTKGEILQTLAELGEDPNSSRVDAIHLRVLAQPLPSGDHETAIRQAVEEAQKRERLQEQFTWTDWFDNPFHAIKAAAEAGGQPAHFGAALRVLLDTASSWELFDSTSLLDDILQEIAEETNIVCQYREVMGGKHEFRAIYDGYVPEIGRNKGAQVIAQVDALLQGEGLERYSARQPAMQRKCDLSELDFQAATLHVEAFTSHEFPDAEFATVKLTPEFVSRILRLRTLCEEEDVEDVRVYAFPDSWSGASQWKPGMSHLHVGRHDFWYVAVPKNVDAEVRTQAVPIDEMVKLLKQQMNEQHDSKCFAWFNGALYCDGCNAELLADVVAEAADFENAASPEM
ncbi:hypothetical protein [Ralstonia sp. ASV6]|uniref:hypothetical protein n=1 Tax=Ralstonia sp. ASV6 TaxID=2795124 RepID=UPI0018ED641B|nr:hypothetical protein [Ralstonia sp. ASV6]